MADRGTVKSELVMNAARISIPEVLVDVYSMPFKDAATLKEIRTQYQDQFAVLRRGDFVVMLPVVVDFLPPDFATVEKRRLDGDLGLVAECVRKSVTKKVKAMGRTVLGRDPLCFLSEAVDLLSIAAGELPVPEWLAVRPQIEICIRTMRTGRSSDLVFVVDVRSAQRIEISCLDLLSAGVFLEGLYVGKPYEDSDKIQNLGRIQEVVGSTARLADYREGFDEVSLDKVFLVPDKNAFDRCLEHSFGTNLEKVNTRLKKVLAAFRAGPERFKRIEAIRKHFTELSLEIIPGVRLEIGEFASSNNSALTHLQNAPKPTYVFDPAGRKTDQWHDRGLNTNGPYSAQTFTPNQPTLCIICQGNRKGQVEQFVKKFLDGVDSGNQKDRFQKGFIRKYALNSVRTEFFTTQNDSPESYQVAAKRAIEHATDKNIKWDMALVQIDEHFHELIGDANPYLTTKALFLSHQIPIQAFEIETAGVSDYQVGFVLNNMALASYAKLGGVPWLLKANPAIAHELVIGVGSALIGEGRLGKRERVVGITTVFSGDGNYWLHNLSQAVPFSNYREALVSSLGRTVNRIRASMNWQKGDLVRLIFHGFKPVKNEEAEAVFEVMNSLSEFDVEVAFVHVVEHHQLQLFDKNQQGSFDYSSRAKKGVWAAERGQFLALSDHETLVVLTGPNDLKTSEQGLPRPVLLRLDKRSTFRDMTYIARQVYAFSNHSWRSFFPSSMPVSILYSDLVASLLGNLNKVSKWNPDAMLGRIGTTRWFL